MYRFLLLDNEGIEVMGTDVEEFNPQIDKEFWDRFMQGDCVMVYEYNYLEEVDCNE
jgi:hypothetical protein